MSATPEEIESDRGSAPENLAGILAALSAVAAELSLDFSADLAALEQQARAGAPLSVAVIGGFNAGKSSLLNHLVGQEVLPVGAVPVTAIVTRLRYAPAQRIVVRFLDGTAAEASLGEARDWISEVTNPENREEVSAVEMELPSLRALAPLDFVDTPGMGSAVGENTQATLRWLPRVGCALLVMSIESPLAQSDLETIELLLRHTPRVALVLSKADLIPAAERAQVVDYVRNRLRRAGRGDIPVYLYSTRLSPDAFRSGVHEELLRPLQQSAAATLEEIVRHKLEALIDRATDHARVALAAATDAGSRLESLRTRLAEERRQFPVMERELRAQTQDWSAGFFDWTLSRLQPAREALRERMVAELRSQFARWRMRLPGFLNAWRSWMQDFLGRELGTLSRRETTVFQAPLGNARAHLLRTLAAFDSRLAGHVKEALGLSLQPRRFALPDKQPALPPVDVAFAFGSAFAILAHLMPLTGLRPWIEPALVAKAEEQLTKNFYRLVSVWRDRVAAEIEWLVADAERRALDELSDLERAARQQPDRAADLRKILLRLDALRATLAAAANSGPV